MELYTTLTLAEWTGLYKKELDEGVYFRGVVCLDK